jgi:hypothetical protein
MSIPQIVQEYIRRRYGKEDVTILTYPIWSYIRFQAAIAAGPPVVYTIDQTARNAFSYAVNGDMAPAGQQGVLATQADTNLKNPGQTRDQADVFIYGISFALDDRSEPALVADVVNETDVQISTNAQTQVPIGLLEMFPSPGGIMGAGLSNVREPNLRTPGGFDGGQGAMQPFMTNGNPTSRSFYELDAPIFWAGLGVGPDSNLNLACTPRRTITRTAALARAAAGDIAPFTPPTSGVFVGGRFRLHAASVQRRGVNSG